MGKLIGVIGNSGVGKTTLTRLLCQRLELVTGLEQHQERPFQQLFAREGARYALANQVDYLLYRAEQETRIRQGAAVGIQDGGLDEDYEVFTRYFHQRGLLTAAEWGICERLYAQLRQRQPPPEVYIYLTAPVPVLQARLAQRNRSLEIAKEADLAALQALLEQWLARLDRAQIIEVDTSGETVDFAGCREALAGQLLARLGEGEVKFQSRVGESDTRFAAGGGG